jgi:tRNA1Val (adenine37-N6)-methyltransferase
MKSFSEEFLFDALNVVQPVKGYRFSVDSIALCAFLMDQSSSETLDIGSGCGIISLILSKLDGYGNFTCVEIQPELHRCAEMNVRKYGIKKRFTLINNDIRKHNEFLAGKKFDLIVSNPPFYTVSAGRINPDDSRAVARHEIFLKMEEIFKIIRTLLTEKGRAVLLYPADRLSNIMENSIKLNLPVAEIVFIHPSPVKPAESFIAVLKKRKSPEITIHPPVYIHEKGSKVHGEKIMELIRRLRGEKKKIMNYEL